MTLQGMPGQHNAFWPANQQTLGYMHTFLLFPWSLVGVQPVGSISIAVNHQPDQVPAAFSNLKGGARSYYDCGLWYAWQAPVATTTLPLSTAEPPVCSERARRPRSHVKLVYDDAKWKLSVSMKQASYSQPHAFTHRNGTGKEPSY
eukprot:2827191-Pleurochrysis_carterae.AAC.1